MTQLTIGGIIAWVVLFVLMFGGLPIAISMLIAGFASFAYIGGLDAALWQLKAAPFSVLNTSYMVSCVPLFVLMGTLCFYGRITQELYKVAYTWVGHLPGGLAMATIAACAGFAAVNGSASATAATMATVALPEMKKYNYSSALATGCVAAGGTLGIMIPPSVAFVLYGLLTQASIGQLFLAGFIPGILQAIFYIIAIYAVCKINPNMGPIGPATSWMTKLFSLKDLWPVLILFGLVMGGLYFGVYTPTEAGGVGAIGALVFALARKGITWPAFKSSLRDTMKITAFIMLLLVGARLFFYSMTLTRLPEELASLIVGAGLNRYVVIFAIILMYVILGCVMDDWSMIILTVPVLLPILKSLGFDTIWFGVICVMMIQIALITPPVGFNVFVIKGMAPDVPMSTIFRGILPFFVGSILLVILIVFVPQLALFIPAHMK
jgi:C4-dicarboxylate transporter DctM subunit